MNQFSILGRTTDGRRKAGDTTRLPQELWGDMEEDPRGGGGRGPERAAVGLVENVNQDMEGTPKDTSTSVLRQPNSTTLQKRQSGTTG